MSYLDPFFGKVFLNGVPVPLAGGLNFVAPYTVTITQDEDGNDVITLGFDQAAIEATFALPDDPGDDYRIPYAFGGDVVYASHLKAASGGLQINGAAALGSAFTIPHNHDFLAGALSTTGFAVLVSWGSTTDAVVWGSQEVERQTSRVATGGSYFWEIGASSIFELDSGGAYITGTLGLGGHTLEAAGGIVTATDGTVNYPLGPIESNGDTSATAINIASDGPFLGSRVRTTAGTAVSITVPADTSDYPVGSVINITQAGDGQITLIASGATLNTPETLKTRKKWSTISLYKVSASVWDVTGDLELAP